jgi:hypothetical protein
MAFAFQAIDQYKIIAAFFSFPEMKLCPGVKTNMSYIRELLKGIFPVNFSRIYPGTVICFSPTNPSLRRVAAMSSDNLITGNL